MPYNIMIGYGIYDCFTIEHFRLRQRMTLTTKIYCSRLYLLCRVKNLNPFFVFFITLNLLYILFYIFQIFGFCFYWVH
jgi:hypothetical protein